MVSAALPAAVPRRGEAGLLVMQALVLLVAVACFALFRLEPRAGSGAAELLLSSTLAACAFALHLTLGRLRGQLAPLWPGLLFPVAFACFHFGSLGSGTWYRPTLLGEVWSLACLGLIGWMLGYGLARGPHTPARPLALDLAPDRLARLAHLSHALFVVALLAQLVFLADYGLLAFFGRDYGKAALSVTGGNWRVYLYSIGALLAAVSATSAALVAAARRQSLFSSRIFAAALGLYLLSLLLEGDRGGLTLFLLPLLTIRHYWVRPFRWRAGLALAIAALLVFTGLKAFRAEKSVDTVWQGVEARGGVNGTVAEMGHTLDTVVRARSMVPERQPFFLGKTYLWAAARAVPNLRFAPRTWGFVSSVWITEETAPDVAARNGGLGFSVVAEAYINFGAFGVPTFLLLLGLLHGRAERWWCGPRVRYAPALLVFLLEVSLLAHVRNTAVIYLRGFLWMAGVVAALVALERVGALIARRGRARASRPQRVDLARWRPSRFPDLPRVDLAKLASIGLLGALPFAVGGVHWPVAAVFAAGAVLVWVSGGGAGARPAGLALVLLGCAAVCLLQLAPLPEPLLRALSPSGLAFWGEALVGARPSISLAPAETASAAIRFVALAGAALLGARLARAEGSPRPVADLIVAVALLATALAFFERFLGFDPYLGLYDVAEPARAGFSGPFVSPNHYAALAGMGALLLAPRLSWRRARGELWAGWGLLVAGVVASGSWAAALALVGAHAPLLARRLPASARRGRRLRWSLVGVCWLGLAAVALALAPAHADKLATMAAAVELLRDFAWTGPGAGAFAALAPGHMPAELGEHYAFVESDALGVALDLGLVGILVVGALLVRWLRRSPRSLDHAARPALAFVGALSLVSFQLPALGVSALAVALLAAAARGPGARRRPEAPPRAEAPPRLGTTAVAVFAVAALAVGFTYRVGAQSCEGAIDPPPSAAAAADLLAWCPASGRAHALAARAFQERGERARAARHAARATELAPNDYRVWALAAQAAHEAGDDELVAQRLARAVVVAPVSSAVRLGERVIHWLDEAELRARALGDSDAAWRGAATALRGRDRGAELFAALSAADDATPELAALRVDSARVDLDEPFLAAGLGEAALRRHPDSSAVRCALARALAADGRPSQALAGLRAGLSLDPDDPALNRGLVDLWLTHADDLGGTLGGEVDAALRVLASRGQGHPGAVRTVRWLRARVAGERRARADATAATEARR